MKSRGDEMFSRQCSHFVPDGTWRRRVTHFYQHYFLRDLSESALWFLPQRRKISRKVRKEIAKVAKPFCDLCMPQLCGPCVNRSREFVYSCYVPHVARKKGCHLSTSIKSPRDYFPVFYRWKFYMLALQKCLRHLMLVENGWIKSQVP